MLMLFKCNFVCPSIHSITFHSNIHIEVLLLSIIVNKKIDSNNDTSFINILGFCRIVFQHCIVDYSVILVSIVRYSQHSFFYVCRLLSSKYSYYICICFFIFFPWIMAVVCPEPGL